MSEIAPAERTVLVDMDGVLADFEKPNNDIIRTHFPEIVPIAYRTDFYFSDTDQHYDGVNEVIDAEVRKPGFIRSFPIIDGAIEGWQRILEAGYTPRVCSSPLENHDTIVAEKIDWLDEYFVPVFGAWVVNTAIFSRDKSGYGAIAMIDDRPTLRNIERAVWQHIVFNQSYNEHVITSFRLDGWQDNSLIQLLKTSEAIYSSKQS